MTQEYQAEIDRHTARAEMAYAVAQRRFSQAKLRRQRALLHAGPGALAQLRAADELVERRREELQRIEALMKAAPASLEHRGRKGYRPIPQPGSVV